MSTTKKSLRRTFTALTVAAAGVLGLVGAPAEVSAAPPAGPSPKPEALSAIDWAMGFCSMALDSSTRREDVPKHYAKFTEKRDIAVAADPSIRTWDGTKRGKKISEWLPKCEKEIPARIEGEGHKAALTEAIEAALKTCRYTTTDEHLAEYKKQKAQAIAINKSENFTITTVNLSNVNAQFAACDKSTVEAVAKAKADAIARKELAEKQDKEALEKINAEIEAKKARAKALRGSLKGDRVKVWDKYGEPHFWDGDLNKTAEWRYSETITRGALEGPCETSVKFKGDKKISEKETGYGCRIR